MPNRSTPLLITPNQNHQLQSVNEKIAKLSVGESCYEMHAAFSRVAQLALKALNLATELEKIPGIERSQIQPVIEFWYSLADQARIAALLCVGGNQTLAEATVAFMFLRTCLDRKPAKIETGISNKEKIIGRQSS